MLLGDPPDLLVLPVRLPRGFCDLTPAIITQVEHEASILTTQ